MTDEEIYELAKDKALDIQKYIIDGNVNIDSFAKDCCLAGAHSRDEEVKQLKESKRKLRLRLMQQIHELCNPWISVDDRLPKYCTVPSTEQYIKNKRYWDSKVAPIYLVICSDPQGDYYQFANFLMFPEDKKPSWVFIEDDIKRNCITHWMPIPQIEKGGEK